MGILSIGICGELGIKNFKPNVEIAIPSKHTPLIQEMHGITTHLICDIVEQSIFKKMIMNFLFIRKVSLEVIPRFIL